MTFQMNSDFNFVVSDTLTVDLHSVMEERLTGNNGLVLTWGPRDNKDTVCSRFGMTYQNLLNIRTSELWIEALEDFISLNELDDAQKTAIGPHKERGPNNGTTSKAKFSATKAKELGFAIFNHSEESKRALDVSHDRFDTVFQNVVGATVAVLHREYEVRRDFGEYAVEDAKAKEEQERLAKLRDDAIEVFGLVGVDPTEEQIQAYIEKHSK